MFSLIITLQTAPSEWSLFSLEQLLDNDEDPEDTIADPDAQEASASAITSTTTSIATNTTPQPAITQPAVTQPTTTQPAILPKFEFTSNNLPSPDASARASPCDGDRTVQNLETSRIPSPPSPDPLIALGELPLGAGESAWMKSKHTLKYFREVHKSGKLSDLILHWHQLEEALGFPEAVGCLSNCLSCKKFS